MDATTTTTGKAKRTIKKLVSVESPYNWSRLGETLTLEPVELERGEGKYLGLNCDKLDLGSLELITTKDEEIKKDADKVHNGFKAKICGMFNSLIFRPLWRESVEKYPAGSLLLPEDWAKVYESFASKLDSWFKEEQVREKTSVHYFKLATEIAKKLAPLRDKAKGKLENLTEAERAEWTTLSAEYKSTLATAKEKEAEEQAGLIEGLEELV
jgi:hypothetical protein